MSAKLPSRLFEEHIGFLDEVFKANSAILNSLLGVINERIYHEAEQVQPMPLLSLFGASNETPEDSGHATAEMQQHYSTVNASEVQESIGKVIVLSKARELLETSKAKKKASGAEGGTEGLKTQKTAIQGMPK